MNLTPAQNARISIVRAGAASADLATRISSLQWAKENFAPVEKAAFFNNMRSFWGDYSPQERSLYLQIAQSADMDLRNGHVGCPFCVGVGCVGKPGCKCQQSPASVSGVGFSLSDFQAGAKTATDLAKEAAALGVTVDTYIQCTKKENWAAPYCPWNKGKPVPDTQNQPGKATTTTPPATAPAPPTKSDDDEESNAPLIAVGVGTALFLLWMMTSNVTPIPIPYQQQTQLRRAA